jgi:hypothetical protein
MIYYVASPDMNRESFTAYIQAREDNPYRDSGDQFRAGADTEELAICRAALLWGKAESEAK